jgi:polar amino acid transport system permease protein
MPPSSVWQQRLVRTPPGEGNVRVNYVFHFGFIWESRFELLRGAMLTLQLSAETMLLGLLLGILGAWAKTSRHSALRGIVQVYIETVRNTPFLVQLLLIYLGLPRLGLLFAPDEAALLAMVVNLGAYATEIVRAGIESVPRGQIEAGRALGLRPWPIFRCIILVPALQAVFPALTSQFILVVLGSSVISTISAEELTAIANNLQAQSFRPFEIYFAVGAIYLAIVLGFQAVFACIQRVAFPAMPAADDTPI